MLFTKMEKERKVQIYGVGVGYGIQSLVSKEKLKQKIYYHTFLPLFIYCLFLFSDLKWKTQTKSKDRLISTAGNNNKHIYELLFTSQTRQLSLEEIMSPLVSITQLNRVYIL